MTFGAGLAACSSTPNNSPAAQSGSAQVDCSHEAKAHAGLQVVPVAVVKANGGNLPTVDVCVGTSGPYPFVVDTGSTESIIDATLSSNLHLAAAGSTALGGSGCATSANLVKVSSLQMGDVPMAGQTLVSVPLTDWSGQSIDGVVGSDILERFGAVKFDMHKHTLTLAGSEGPAVSLHSLVKGQGGTPPPKDLLSGAPAVNVPLTIIDAPGSVGVYANTTVANQGPYPLVIASGSPTSALAPVTGLSLHLADKGNGPVPGGVGCHGDVPILTATSVSIATSPTAQLSFHAVPINGAARTGVNGWLGLDYLGGHPITIVNYVQASLVQADKS
jgi:hypothetical protein